ncbi:hypothetical protein [Chitinophaga sancti]|uniref:Uncharacterized protein n=1 Tax=Chitinophaga sancti TaxID=1004 RepID=A0ABZ0XGN5_9BACT|nr:hypothetical protein [Chitinophaga sancti]WQD64738.1 hypothetical protein U0033_10055 [Chitinophaga sancti]WQG89640.1 hypothetical protein SR876_32420 [Chitinophaga sancti]
MNSIQCARMALAFDVLVYASEEKELNEAQHLDYEAEREKSK